ncbi:chromodomain Y-like protein isoform X1 [Salvelinus sp. IW2-2015]|uniref:chromodomain Y-like protein isoform X1 n=2 Tax=Salvelinus TaxID=8033 RepID=UPI000CDF85E5|nr:chromodomain Y-like protein isoform X1 [Salvelinus alpinus]
MASEELYEEMATMSCFWDGSISESFSCFYEKVERIVDKRKNKKGKIEYLVRWRGYGYEGDTWEPETHLSACVEFIHDFNRQHGERQRDSTLLRSTRSTPSTTHSHSSRNNARKQICRPQPPSGAGSHALVKHGNDSSPTTAATAISKQLPPLDAGVAHTRTNMQLNLSQKYSVSATGDICRPGFTSGPAASPVGTVRRSMDLAKSGIKILVPKSPMSSRADSESSPSEAAHCLEQGGQEQDSVPPEVALLEKPPGLLLGPGEERARMGTRPRTQSPLIPQQVPITPASIRTLNGKGTSTLMEALAANGTASLQSAVAGVTAVSGVAGKRRFEEQRSVFDKRLRFSVRQTESAYRYRDLVVKKQDGFTHILLSTKSSENNSLNPDVMKEMQSAMATAAADDSKLVLLSAVGSIFCFGLDFIYFIRRLTDDRKKESIKMAETIRTFVNTFIQFKKPIIVAVNGPAVGLGASILPLCDVVWANEKSWFQTPYTTYGQTPDACASLTFPRIMGVASANEMLLSGRKLTAQEACAKGLVSQVLWPGTFTQEVMVRIRELVTCNSVVLRESKALVRNANRAALEQANERECEALKRVWGSSQGVDSILKYLQKKIDEF